MTLNTLIKNKILILNGCPSTGKDSLAHHIWNSSNCEWESFKKPLFEIASAISGYPLGVLLELYAKRDWKEKPNPKFGGLSCRQFFIKISEEWVKPVLGTPYFGDRMVERLVGNVSNGVVVSDGGFPEELSPIIKEFGNNNVIVVRIYRDGYTFDNDSRCYLHSGMFEAGKEPFFINIHNKAADVGGFCQEAVEDIEAFLKEVSYDKH